QRLFDPRGYVDDRPIEERFPDVRDHGALRLAGAALCLTALLRVTIEYLPEGRQLCQMLVDRGDPFRQKFQHLLALPLVLKRKKSLDVRKTEAVALRLLDEPDALLGAFVVSAQAASRPHGARQQS